MAKIRVMLVSWFVQTRPLWPGKGGAMEWPAMLGWLIAVAILNWLHQVVPLWWARFEHWLASLQQPRRDE